ncbi:MAG: glycosyltransferase family 4 protein [Syntrophomonadaceae bacterium]|nr:glycosyltransferase family 4 protein [Syntrophomonadaceae bacterium]
MKIGFFSESYKPYASGVVTSLTTFKDELERLGHEVFVFAPSYSHYSDEEKNVFRYVSLTAPSNPDYSLAVPIYPGMSQRVRHLNLDIIHVHSPFTMGLQGMKYARRYSKPCVFTYHTRYDQYVHYLLKAPLVARDAAIKYSAYFCNQCDHIITPSQDIKSILRNAAVLKPITVLPTGIPLDKLSQGDSGWLRRNYAIADDARILLFVGRLTIEKNLPFLLKSFALIRQRQKCVLVLTAQGPMEQELRRLSLELGIEPGKDIIFTGALPYERMCDVYHSADLFVFSSLTETQGLVLIEAMAAGLPVVAVRATGVRDMVTDGVDGLLCPPDINEFAAAAVRILTRDELYRSLRQGALRKAKLLSSAGAARRLESIYGALVENNQATPPNGRLPDKLRERIKGLPRPELPWI